MKPPAATARKDLRTLDDLMQEFHLLPDDSDLDAAQLFSALVSDLAPRTPMEKLIVRDLVDLELERARCRRWIQMAVMDAVYQQMLARGEGGGLKARDQKRYRDLWNSGDTKARHDVIRALSDGIDPTPHVLQARLRQAEIIDGFEDRIREIEHRRRRLHDDLTRLQQRTRPMIAEAETVDLA